MLWLKLIHVNKRGSWQVDASCFQLKVNFLNLKDSWYSRIMNIIKKTVEQDMNWIASWTKKAVIIQTIDSKIFSWVKIYLLFLPYIIP